MGRFCWFLLLKYQFGHGTKKARTNPGCCIGVFIKFSIEKYKSLDAG